MKQNGKTKKETKDNTGLFVYDSERRNKIIGLLLFTLGLFIFLSILSYNPGDISHYSLDKTSGSPSNWMGKLGVFTANFFVVSLTGITSVVFPAIMWIWAYFLFKAIDLRKCVHITNFLFIFTVLVSSFFGIIDKILSGLPYLLYGYIGSNIGTFLYELFGGFFSILLIVVAFVILLILSFNLKIETFFIWLKEFSTNRSKQAYEKIKEQRARQKESLKTEKSGDEAPANTGNPVHEGVNGKKEPVIKIARENKQESGEKNNSPIQEKPSAQPSPVLEHLLDDEVKDSTGETAVTVKDEDVEIPDRVAEGEMPDPWEEKIRFIPLPLELLAKPPAENVKVADDELQTKGIKLKEKLAIFGIDVEDITIQPGPVVTLFKIVPSESVKISRIVALENDIALALAARGIRIIAPIPGEKAIGVEIPNESPTLVVGRSVLSNIRNQKMELPLGLGLSISGEPFYGDLAKIPHLLIAGSTGSGKSVGINMIITSLLYAKKPEEVKFAIIDPKKIELSFYRGLRSHYLAVCPDLNEDIVTEPQNAILLLKSVVLEMENRYDMLAKASVRNIIEYNTKIADPVKRPKDTDSIKHHFLAYIVVIIDELADLMITAGKEVEEPIARLAQLARAVGIHLVVATQRPSVNVITGTIKANFSARIAYQVASKIDSRTILDGNGAEQLLGRGDMLYLAQGSSKAVRIQNAFISTDEVEKVTDFIKEQRGYSKPYPLPSVSGNKDTGRRQIEDLDDLFEEAAKVVILHQQGSVSLLQRKLKLGYARAARIIDQMEQLGIVGPNDGSKAREVRINSIEELEVILRNL